MRNPSGAAADKPEDQPVVGEVILDRLTILGAEDIASETVPVPEWGGSVIVRGMTGALRDKFERSMVEIQGKNYSTNYNNFRARLVSFSIVDSEGKLLFRPSDVDALGEKSATALGRVFDVAQRLSGMGDDDIEELTKALKVVPSGDSGSA